MTPGSSWTGIGRGVKIVLLDEAQERFEAEDRWWREHRDAKELFVTEFEEAVRHVAAAPGIGQQYRRTRGRLIQRVLMPKTRSTSTTSTTRTATFSRFIRSGAHDENVDPACSQVLACLIGQRRSEIAIRLALGATRSEVVWLVVKRGYSWPVPV